MSTSLKHPVVKTYMSYVYIPGSLNMATVYETADLDYYVNEWIKDMLTKHGGSVEVVPLPPKAMVVPVTGLGLFIHQTTIIWTPSPDSTR